ncbi:MAG: TylF/MycF/NovP-related O-methyltransferase [Terriglobia bacterium]
MTAGGGRFEALVKVAASQVQALRLRNLERIFAHSPGTLSYDQRKGLANSFARVGKEIALSHSPGELLFIAARVLSSSVKGPVVECGCYLGASTAKLSMVAKLTGRSLFACDTFEGLPGDAKHASYHHVDGRARRFEAGEYAGSLEIVRGNVERYGALEMCTFVRGLFQDTLPQLNVDPAFVFMDVDYVSSARDCLKNLWPRLRPGGYFFTHEAGFIEYVEGITDGRWWHENLGQCPPPTLWSWIRHWFNVSLSGLLSQAYRVTG